MFEGWRDGWAVMLSGGSRVRVTGQGEAVARGRTVAKLTPERVRRAVLDVGPPGSGTLDVVPYGSGFRVRGAGALADPRFLQRVRNVLGN